MGYFCETHCQNCGYKMKFRLGSGRKDYNIKRIYSHFNLMDVWTIKVAMLERNVKILNFRYRMGRCADCGELKAVPAVTFTDGTGFYAKECSCQTEKEHEMALWDAEEEPRAVCPGCGKDLHLKQCGLWD